MSLACLVSHVSMACEVCGTGLYMSVLPVDNSSDCRAHMGNNRSKPAQWKVVHPAEVTLQNNPGVQEPVTGIDHGVHLESGVIFEGSAVKGTDGQEYVHCTNGAYPPLSSFASGSCVCERV